MSELIQTNRQYSYKHREFAKKIIVWSNIMTYGITLALMSPKYQSNSNDFIQMIVSNYQLYFCA